MWGISALVFLANPLLGAVLLMSAAITTGLKVATVDRELAKQGKPPASYGLVEKWLEGRKARGKAPASAKVAKPGMWAYAWQRWRALWEGLAADHKARHEQYMADKAKAVAEGTAPPAKPTVKSEKRAIWQWLLDNALVRPVGEKKEPQPADKADSVDGPMGLDLDLDDRPKPDEPVIACDECGVTLPEGAWEHPAGSNCPKAHRKPVPAEPRKPLQSLTTTLNCQFCGHPVTSTHPVSAKVGVDRHERDCPKNPANGPSPNFGFHCPKCDRTFQYLQHPADAAAAEKVHAGLCQGPRHSICDLCGTQHPPFACPADQACWDEATATAPVDPQHVQELFGVNYDPAPGYPANPLDTITRGDDMTAAMSGEVTGIPSAIHYMRQVAAIHRTHAASAEQAGHAMQKMTVTGSDENNLATAKEASEKAAAAWETAADAIELHNQGVREAYGAAPGAAEKQYQTAE